MFILWLQVLYQRSLANQSPDRGSTYEVKRASALEADRLGFECWLCRLLAVGHWASYLASL